MYRFVKTVLVEIETRLICLQSVLCFRSLEIHYLITRKDFQGIHFANFFDSADSADPSSFAPSSGEVFPHDSRLQFSPSGRSCV